MKTTYSGSRLRVVLLAGIFAFTAFAVDAAPTGTAPSRTGGSFQFDLSALSLDLSGLSIPLPLGPVRMGPRIANAAYCSTPNPAFTGHLTASSSSSTAVSRITNANVYGYISTVNENWSCTLYRRYSAVAWNTTTTTGTFDWGTLINSTSVACNWLIGSTDYLKANDTADCPDSDAEYAMQVTLSPQGVYHADVGHNSLYDFSFSHVDCDTTPYYGAEVIKTSASFSTSATNNRPGANCDAISLDSQGTAQTVTYDSTDPALAFDAPAAGGPAVVSSGSYTVQFDATDAVAGFGGTNDWDLQRQIAPGIPTGCSMPATTASRSTTQRRTRPPPTTRSTTI
jgi:hypothetical protein